MNLDDLNLDKKQKKKLNKMNRQLIWGLMRKRVFPYPDKLFDYLRPYCIAGLPASIVLFITELCNGFCYDRAMLMQLAFNNCKVVHANIETLRITSGEDLAGHAFVETTDFGGGKTWVVDTSIGLIYEKEFYYKLEKPIVTQTFSKEECMNHPEIKRILASNFEEEKYALPMMMDFIELVINNSNYLGTSGYRDILKKELALFKSAINYEAIKQEVEDDIKIMYTHPSKLDEKFKIVRDRFGREISRGGKPNPYYLSPEELDARDACVKSIQNDDEKLKDFFLELAQKSYNELEVEEEQISILAKKRIEEILQNPTANFYDTSQSQPNN